MIDVIKTMTPIGEVMATLERIDAMHDDDNPGEQGLFGIYDADTCTPLKKTEALLQSVRETAAAMTSAVDACAKDMKPARGRDLDHLGQMYGVTRWRFWIFAWPFDKAFRVRIKEALVQR